MTLLRRLGVAEVAALPRLAIDPETLARAAIIVEDVRRRGEVALREQAIRLGDLKDGARMIHHPSDLAAAFDGLTADARSLLERTATRIRTFAEAQRRALAPVRLLIAGGEAGHAVLPLEAAGCYAPGGRFPLPSSVLMTAVTARTAGVRTVWVASPHPAPITLAAAHVAGADALLAVGGAQAIAALAFGAGEVPACDAVVGPGNRWVTAAKQLVAGHVAIDFLAGPSELLVLADRSADPAWLAADLLAQAEHDPDALPALVALDASTVDEVERELEKQLGALPPSNADTARAALGNGFAVVAPDLETAIRLCDRVAPEHLELCCADAARIAPRLLHYGALFVGGVAGEVLGDYGAGPNHVLPTGGTARAQGGLSVFTFLRTRTWLRIDRPEEASELVADAVGLARHEGLEAHARAAERRLGRRRP